MVNVPAGEFMMGCNSSLDNQCGDDENPYHKVYLDAFYIDKYEVTVEQYGACVKAGKCKKAHFDDGTCYVYQGESQKQGTLPQSFRGARQPVVCVDWSQARAFCEYADKRLPTEAEWEKAARGTDERKYPWGSQKVSCDYAAMNEGGRGCGREFTWPVGSKPKGASPFGAMDMAGNVWEWTADWYDGKYYKKSPGRNPAGPSSGEARVLRGGSWCHRPVNLRSSTRHGYIPDGRADSLGFRCGARSKN